MDLAIAANQQDSLASQLSFELPSTASYALERRLVSVQSSGASQFAPGGNTVMRFNLTSADGWLDPASLRLHFTVFNQDANDELRPAAGCHCYFSQVRVLIGGVEVEKIEPYGRSHELFRCVLNTPNSQIDMAVEDGRAYNNAVFPPVAPKFIPAGQRYDVCLNPMLGLMGTGKYMPLRYANIVLEFTLASVADALAVDSVADDFNLEQTEIRMSVVRLDSALESGFASMLMSGRALQLNLRTVLNQSIVIPAGSTTFQASVVRALSRIAGIFVTFQGDHATTQHITQFVNPSKLSDAPGAAANAENGVRYLLKWKIQLGSKQWPEHSPCGSLAETMSLLRQAIQTYDSNVVSTSVTEQTYRGTKFAVGVPTSVLPAPFSGVSSRSGDLLTATFENLTIAPTRRAVKAYISIIAETILEIREGGATLLE